MKNNDLSWLRELVRMTWGSFIGPREPFITAHEYTPGMVNSHGAPVCYVCWQAKRWHVETG